MTDKTKEELTKKLLSLIGSLPVAQSFAIAEFIDDIIDQEKRKEAIAFALWIRENPVFNDIKDHWLYGDKIVATKELYDLYLQSLTTTP